MNIVDKLDTLTPNELQLVVNLIDTLSANKLSVVVKSVSVQNTEVSQKIQSAPQSKSADGVLVLNPNKKTAKRMNSGKIGKSRKGRGEQQEPRKGQGKAKNYGKTMEIDCSPRPNLFFELKDGSKLIAETSKEDTVIDKLLHVAPPVSRRESSLINIDCAECGDNFDINPILLKKDVESGDVFFICNSCEVEKAAGRIGDE